MSSTPESTNPRDYLVVELADGIFQRETARPAPGIPRRPSREQDGSSQIYQTAKMAYVLRGGAT